MKLWIPPILYGGFIFYLSSYPSSLMTLPVGWDKLFHIAEYAILGWLLARAVRAHYFKLEPLKFYIFIFLIGTSYGIFDEIHQLFVPNRIFSLWDIACDGIGVLLGARAYQ